MPKRNSTPNSTPSSTPKSKDELSAKPREMTIYAIDPENAEREELGQWMVDERWQIVEIRGVGHYQEMLEEISEEMNELDELECSDSNVATQVEPDWADRGSPRFGSAFAAYLKDEFDLECQPPK